MSSQKTVCSLLFTLLSMLMMSQISILPVDTWRGAECKRTAIRHECPHTCVCPAQSEKSWSCDCSCRWVDCAGGGGPDAEGVESRAVPLLWVATSARSCRNLSKSERHSSEWTQVNARVNRKCWVVVFSQCGKRDAVPSLVTPSLTDGCSSCVPKRNNTTQGQIIIVSLKKTHGRTHVISPRRTTTMCQCHVSQSFSLALSRNESTESYCWSNSFIKCSIFFSLHGDKMHIPPPWPDTSCPGLLQGSPPLLGPRTWHCQEGHNTVLLYNVELSS